MRGLVGNAQSVVSTHVRSVAPTSLCVEVHDGSHIPAGTAPPSKKVARSWTRILDACGRYADVDLLFLQEVSGALVTALRAAPALAERFEARLSRARRCEDASRDAPPICLRGAPERPLRDRPETSLRSFREVLEPRDCDAVRDQNSLILVAKRLLAGPAGEALSEVELGAEALSGALATGRRGRGRGMWSPGARRGLESRCAAAAGDDRGWNTLGSLMRDE